MSVSRETSQRLVAFGALVRKWNKAINLVSRGSLAELEIRHIADSEQVFEAASVRRGHWVDLGSGGGFPGLVVAILGAPDLRVTLIEADRRKAAFLATAARELALSVEVIAERIEAVAPQGADVVSARALAPLSVLLPMARRHLRPNGFAIFPKGAGHAMEVAEARENWRFTLAEIPSRTDPHACILKLGEISGA